MSARWRRAAVGQVEAIESSRVKLGKGGCLGSGSGVAG